MIQPQQTIIIGFIGDQGVGKSTIISNYFKNYSLSQQYKPTIALQILYSSYQCDQGTIVRVKCWDTSGQKKYQNIIAYHLKQADIIVMVFDLTNLSSYNKIDQYLKQFNQQNLSPTVLYLVGNKLDLIKTHTTLRQVNTKDASIKAQSLKATYMQITAKYNQNLSFINDAFQQILTSRAIKIIQLNKINTINPNDNIMKQICKNQVHSNCQCHIF